MTVVPFTQERLTLDVMIQVLAYLAAFCAFIWFAQFSTRKLMDYNRRQTLIHASGDFDSLETPDHIRIRECAKLFQGLRYRKLGNAFETRSAGRRGCVFDYYLLKNDNGETTRNWDSACLVELTSPFVFKVRHDAPVFENLTASQLHRTQLSKHYSIYTEGTKGIPSKLQDALRPLLEDRLVLEMDIQQGVLLIRPRLVFPARRIPRAASDWWRLGVRLTLSGRAYVEPTGFWQLLAVGFQAAEKIESVSAQNAGDGR